MVCRHLIVDYVYPYFFSIKLLIHFHISNNKSTRPTLSYNIRNITEIGDTLTKVMNRDDISFKSQYIFEKLANIDKGFTFNITHDLNNKVTGIVWMTSYRRDNFERFGNYLSLLCYIIIVLYFIVLYCIVLYCDVLS